MIKFRDLRADEIECRVAQKSKDGKKVKLLLYKDARCDMNILDETVGMENWQRHHTRDNANCVVAIWDAEKKQWIEKEDTGTESKTEAQKGLASDSFKRACFNFGVGRELYTAPKNIWVNCDKQYPSFSVEYIKIENKKIVDLTIKDDDDGRIVYRMHPANATRPQQNMNAQPVDASISGNQTAKAQMIEEAANALIDAPKISTLAKMARDKGISLDIILARYKVKNLESLTVAQWNNAMKSLEKTTPKAGS